MAVGYSAAKRACTDAEIGDWRHEAHDADGGMRVDGATGPNGPAGPAAPAVPRRAVPPAHPAANPPAITPAVSPAQPYRAARGQQAGVVEGKDGYLEALHLVAQPHDAAVLTVLEGKFCV